MDDTSLDTFYADAELTFDEVMAVVKYKITHNIPMTTAKEEFVEDTLKDAADLFGYDFVYERRE